MDAGLVALLAGMISIVLVALAVRGVFRRDGRGRGGGVANALADLDAMLQPHHPDAQILAKAREQTEEHDDDGDPPEPGRAP